MARLVRHGQDAVFLLLAHVAAGGHLQPRRLQQQWRVARPEWPDARQVVDEPERELGQRHGGVDGEGRAVRTGAVCGARRGHLRGERAAERGNLLRLHREARGHRVTAVAHQQVRGGRDCRRDVDPFDRPRGAAAGPVARGGDERDRLAIAIHQAAGHDSDDARRPMRAGQHERGVVEQRPVGPDLRLGLLRHPVGEKLAPRVERLQVGRDDARLRRVRRRQQLDACGRVRKPAGRVEPRRQHEGDVLLRQVRRVQLRGLTERDEAQPPRGAERPEATLRQVARVARHHGQVRDDAERREVRVCEGVLRAARGAVERLRKLVGHAGAGEVVQEVHGAAALVAAPSSLAEQLRVDDGGGIRQGGGQVVMVGDDHVDAPA